MTRFLLGEMAEPERLGVERRFLAEEAFGESLLALEDELMYDYLQGRLGAAERAAFAARYLPDTTRERRARAVLSVLAPAEGRRAVWPWLTLAAAVVLAVALGWSVAEQRRLAEELRVVRREPVVVAMALRPGTARGETTQQLVRVGAGVEVVRLQLHGAGAAAVEIWNADGAVIWRGTAREGAVDIIVGLLPDGDYEARAGGGLVFSFAVTRRAV